MGQSGGPGVIYVVGDIHGQLGQLETALNRIEADGGGRVIFLGDLIDRGADSRRVIETLMEGQAAGRDWHVLKGNHDRLAARFLRPEPMYDPQILIGLDWLAPKIGGREMLASYGVTVTDQMRYFQIHAEAMAAVPQAHIDFLDGLLPTFDAGDFFCAHAGIRPGVALADQSEDDLCWIRNVFLDDRRAHPKLIVHGHTAVMAPEHHGNRVNLDSGAAFGRDLTAAVFEGTDCFVLTDTGRVALLP
ncbi:MAG TPA: serine/threonine protein phosphatase [Rhodobacteraceae bacterium]|nr:serine/threonine protein phosphatase [Paracoccaceae bacterium]HBV56178.1 serine/threonine protein phosphatase [Paracoccaceae bacterium]